MLFSKSRNFLLYSVFQILSASFVTLNRIMILMAIMSYLKHLWCTCATNHVCSSIELGHSGSVLKQRFKTFWYPGFIILVLGLGLYSCPFFFPLLFFFQPGKIFYQDSLIQPFPSSISPKTLLLDLLNILLFVYEMNVTHNQFKYILGLSYIN